MLIWLKENQLKSICKYCKVFLNNLILLLKVTRASEKSEHLKKDFREWNLTFFHCIILSNKRSYIFLQTLSLWRTNNFAVKMNVAIFFSLAKPIYSVNLINTLGKTFKVVKTWLKLWHLWRNAVFENLSKPSDSNCIALYLWYCAPVAAHLLVKCQFCQNDHCIGNTESKMCLRGIQIFRSTDGTLVVSF